MSGLLGTTRLLKPWGRSDLPPPFADDRGEPVGEIWFDVPPLMPRILAKYLFTGERLSVQVHPQAEHSPTGVGKDECWLVTDALPGARLAVGFRDRFEPDEIRRAALDGSIEDMLAWHGVTQGDFIYVPSGTIHSMGPGLTLVEIQQNTDITYRLYDYGRPRDLHLDEAMDTILGAPHPEDLRTRVDADTDRLLVDGAHFRLGHCAGPPGDAMREAFGGPVQVLPLERHCTILGKTVQAGGSGWALSLAEIDFSNSGHCLLLANPQPRRGS
ncbi:class I mannose-6-phosphate isomerase [Qipengyuania aurantiaca]|uniref:Class I mannose-6-phosphate isomerase n=1 Tax=Qipengyuania aurantiaca TaxID=2867233 RepID=A0ABX8ZMA0_9SPHN|nr:class I mannose-6-phosphate isomerase [Qipengyuania aurantiaca]QZD88829.1 class I mannose-6-phosphate isomerase [Qipengyuania aurantiaca]